MKKIITALSFCAALFLGGCSDDDAEIFVSQTDFSDVTYEESSVNVKIDTKGEWTATSFDRWLTPSATEGTDNAELTVKIAANAGEARKGKVVLRGTNGTLIDINVSQQAYPEGEEYHYKLPVIFHVLYKNRADNRQYVKYDRLVKLLDEVNQIYRGERKYIQGEEGVDMNLEFVLATTNEEGEQLEKPGVEYIQVDQMPISCLAFADDPDAVKYLWDPNKYINVMLYNFDDVQDGGTILGLSNLPYTLSGPNSLEGLQRSLLSYVSKENLYYPHGVNINSLAIYEDRYSGNKNNSMAAVVTLAHELGHYLGLYHSFDEDPNGGLATNCIDSDYCTDTPSYNRDAYLQLYQAYAYQYGGYDKVPLSLGAKRIDCDTDEYFTSYNLMDYECSYADRFTPQQRARVRNVLTYSPLIPGPKKGSAATRVAVPGKVKLPARVMR